MQIDGSQTIATLIPIEIIVAMPPMATQHAEAKQDKEDAIFSSIPTLKILQTLTIIDNLSGVEEAKEESPKAMMPITHIEEEK